MKMGTDQGGNKDKHLEKIKFVVISEYQNLERGILGEEGQEPY